MDRQTGLDRHHGSVHWINYSMAQSARGSPSKKSCPVNLSTWIVFPCFLWNSQSSQCFVLPSCCHWIYSEICSSPTARVQPSLIGYGHWHCRFHVRGIIILFLPKFHCKLRVMLGRGVCDGGNDKDQVAESHSLRYLYHHGCRKFEKIYYSSPKPRTPRWACNHVLCNTSRTVLDYNLDDD